MVFMKGWVVGKMGVLGVVAFDAGVNGTLESFLSPRFQLLLCTIAGYCRVLRPGSPLVLGPHHLYFPNRFVVHNKLRKLNLVKVLTRSLHPGISLLIIDI